MRRPVRHATVLAALLIAASLPAPRPAAAQGAQPPHAWLFGSWTGGLFPVPGAVRPEACFSQPTVIFTRDVVMRATITSQLFNQRLVATARATSNGTEFRFVATTPAAGGSNSLLGLSAPQPQPGFGCESADVLHVVRHGENEITFPGCRDFPYPLVRCGAR